MIRNPSAQISLVNPNVLQPLQQTPALGVNSPDPDQHGLANFQFQSFSFNSLGGPLVAGPALLTKICELRVDKLTGQYFSAVLRVRDVAVF